MSETSGSSTPGADETRRPRPRPEGPQPAAQRLFGGTRTPARAPGGEGNVGPGDKPEAPTDEPETRADEPDGWAAVSRRATPRLSTPAATITAGPVSTVVPSSTRTDSRPPGTSTTTVPSCPAGRDERGVGGGAGAGAAGPGLPDAALVHPQPDVRSPGVEHVDQLDVDAVGEQAGVERPARPERSRASRSTSVRQARCGLPIETASPAKHPAVDGRPCPRRTAGPGPCRPSSGRRAVAPTRRGPPRVPTRTPASQAGAVEQPLGDQHVQEQPDAVAAHLGVRAVGVAVVHEPLARRQVPRRGRRRVGHVHASGRRAARRRRPGPARRSHSRRTSAASSRASGQTRAVGVGQHDEVVLGAVPEEHPRAGRSVTRSIVRAAISRGDRVEQVGAAGVEPGRAPGRGGTRSAGGGRTGGWWSPCARGPRRR